MKEKCLLLLNMDWVIIAEVESIRELIAEIAVELEVHVLKKYNHYEDELCITLRGDLSPVDVESIVNDHGVIVTSGVCVHEPDYYIKDDGLVNEPGINLKRLCDHFLDLKHVDDATVIDKVYEVLAVNKKIIRSVN